LKVASWSAFGDANKLPPCAAMIERLIDSPIPMPLALVVKKALNSRSAFAESIPMPESCTATSTSPASCGCDRISISRGPIGDRRHRFEAVHHEVDDHLLQLNAIAEHRGQCGRQFRPQRHPLVQSFSSLSSIHPRRALDSRNRDANFHAFRISSD
jgi:hypothetical protein